MSTKANGPLMEDYNRALKAAKRAGAKAVRLEFGDGAIAIILDDNYLDKLPQGQPPAQNAGKKVKLDW